MAGQASINHVTGEFEFGDIQSETRRCLGNIRAVLEAAGCSLDDVVRVGVYLSNLEDFGAMNEVYQEFFGQDPPARTTVGVQLPKIKIEIDCIARIRSHEKKKSKAIVFDRPSRLNIKRRGITFKKAS